MWHGTRAGVTRETIYDECEGCEIDRNKGEEGTAGETSVYQGSGGKNDIAIGGGRWQREVGGTRLIQQGESIRTKKGRRRKEKVYITGIFEDIGEMRIP